MGMFKNRCGQCGHGTLKLTASTNAGGLKVDSIIFECWAMSKMAVAF